MDRFFNWLNQQPIWIRLPLTLLLAPVMLAYAVVAIAVFLLFVLPWMLLAGWRNDRRFRRNLSESGRVCPWPDVEARLKSGRGTVLVEIGPKGAGYAWWIDDDRSALDPEGALPSWSQWHGHEFGVDPGDFVDTEAIRRWCESRLEQYAKAACLTRVPLRLQRRPDWNLPEQRVVVLPYWAGDSLTRRCRGAPCGDPQPSSEA